jgi:hypothetical protein
MPLEDELTIKDPQGNTLEAWESTFGQDEIPIPMGKRKAQLWKKMPAAFYNWVRKMTILRLNNIDTIFRQRVLWEDVENFFWLEEDSSRRPPIVATVNTHSGWLFRKEVAKKEELLWKARARYANGAVRLYLTSASANVGDVVFSVGVAQDLDGPFIVYSPTEPFSFDPQAPQPQVFDIEFGENTLTPGKIYYYKLIREYDHQGDTLGADVLITRVMTR